MMTMMTMMDHSTIRSGFGRLEVAREKVRRRRLFLNWTKRWDKGGLFSDGEVNRGAIVRIAAGLLAVEFARQQF
jgi:hypothetical protein